MAKIKRRNNTMAKIKRKHNTMAKIKRKHNDPHNTTQNKIKIEQHKPY